MAPTMPTVSANRGRVLGDGRTNLRYELWQNLDHFRDDLGKALDEPRKKRDGAVNERRYQCRHLVDEAGNEPDEAVNERH